MLSERQIKIVEFILNSMSGAYAKEVADLASITTRTLRNEINEINSSSDCKDIIESDNIRGYFIPEDKQHEVRSFLFERQSNLGVVDDSRLLSIIGYLLERDQNKFDLAEKLFISEQTLYRNVSEVKKKIQEEFNVKIAHLDDSYSLTATEVEKRKLIYRMVLRYQPVTEKHVIGFLELLAPDTFDENEYTSIRKKTYESFTKNSSSLLKGNLLVLSSVIYLTSIRKNEALELEELDKEYSDLETMVSKKIQDNFDISLLGANLLSEFISTFNIFDIEIDDFTRVIMSEFADDVLEKYNYDIKSSQTLYDNLLLHCEFMLKRIKEEYGLENPLMKHIKNTYPLSFEMSMLIVPIIYKYKQVYLTEDEISYVALYMEQFVQNFNKKIKVLVEDYERKAVYNNVMLWLETNYSKYIEIVISDNRNNIIEIVKNEGIELIISFDDSLLHPIVPTYRIYNMPNDRDVEHLNALIYQIKIKHRFRSVVKNCFEDEAIILFEDKVSFDEVIEELTSSMESLAWIDNSKEYKQEIIDREKIYPTTMGNGVMMPHPLFYYANKTCMSVGILKHPIKCNDNLINLVLLLGTEQKENDDITILFSLVDEIVKDRNLDKILTETTLGNDFINYLYSK